MVQILSMLPCSAIARVSSAFAGVMFYEAVQSSPVDAAEAAHATTALAYTQV